MGETGCDIWGKGVCVGELKKNEKRELISDKWGKRGATYGKKGVCRRIHLGEERQRALLVHRPTPAEGQHPPLPTPLLVFEPPGEDAIAQLEALVPRVISHRELPDHPVRALVLLPRRLVPNALGRHVSRREAPMGEPRRELRVGGKKQNKSQQPFFPICGDPISPICQKQNTFSLPTLDE